MQAQHSKYRLQFDISPDVIKELEELQRKIGTPNKAETIRNALRMHQWILDARPPIVVGENGKGISKAAKPLVETENDPANHHRANETNFERDTAATSAIHLSLIDPAVYQALNRHPDLLHTLDWRVFEKLLADILDRMGYQVDLLRGTKDGGIDIIAVKKSYVMGPHKYLLQAKRWANRVGVEPVRELLFLHGHERATKSCLATTSRFTQGAWQLADRYRWQLELRDFDGIHEWISDVIRAM